MNRPYGYYPQSQAWGIGPAHELFKIYQDNLMVLGQALNPQCWFNVWAGADVVVLINEQERALLELHRLTLLIKNPLKYTQEISHG